MATDRRASKQVRNLDTAFLRGVRDCLNLVPKNQTTYRKDEAVLRACYMRGHRYAERNLTAAQVMVHWRERGDSDDE